MLSIPARLLAIIAALRQAVASHAAALAQGTPVVWLGGQSFIARPAANHPPLLPPETWVLLTARLGRIAARFHRLFTRWQAGKLPAPRLSRAGQPRTRAPYLRLPAARGWINARVAATAPCAGALGHLLQDPATPAFLAAIPSAGRLLRPLCHALAVDAPPCLLLPVKPRPRRPKPLPAATPTGTPDRPLPANIRAAARHWRRRLA